MADAKPVQINGFCSMEAGQYLNFAALNYGVENQWLLRVYANFGLEAHPLPQLGLYGSIEGKMWYQTFPKKYMRALQVYSDVPTQFYSFYIDRAEGVYTFGKIEKPWLQIGFGYFPFKYNPDARNLGEYLFRSGTYPAYIINYFDFPQARLAGLRLRSKLGPVCQDLLFTMETDIPPLLDFNGAYLASWNLFDIFAVGAGAAFRSLFSGNDSVTTPKTDDTRLVLNADTLSDGTISGDTAYYTFRGLKLMGRFSFDPKRIFVRSGQFRLLGKEDLKLYGEAAILGVKNYPANRANPYGYDTLINKMPIMAGLNLPTFKLLDVLAVEAEWYRCRYPNSFLNQEVGIVPIPDISQDARFDDCYRGKNNIKWSFYAKKTTDIGLDFVAQISRDHSRTESPFNYSKDREEALRSDTSWSWMAKVTWHF